MRNHGIYQFVPSLDFQGLAGLLGGYLVRYPFFPVRPAMPVRFARVSDFFVQTHSCHVCRLLGYFGDLGIDLVNPIGFIHGRVKISRFAFGDVVGRTGRLQKEHNLTVCVWGLCFLHRSITHSTTS